jgi:hypothetical protein
MLCLFNLFRFASTLILMMMIRCPNANMPHVQVIADPILGALWHAGGGTSLSSPLTRTDQKVVQLFRSKARKCNSLISITQTSIWFTGWGEESGRLNICESWLASFEELLHLLLLHGFDFVWFPTTGSHNCQIANTSSCCWLITAVKKMQSKSKTKCMQSTFRHHNCTSHAAATEKNTNDFMLLLRLWCLKPEITQQWWGYQEDDCLTETHICLWFCRRDLLWGTFCCSGRMGRNND